MDRMGKVSLPIHRKRKIGLTGERHRILNFKHFVALKEDQISPEKAFQEYSKYLLDFLNNEITLYFDKYEHLPFFLEKFHPYYLEKGFELSRASFLHVSSQFLSSGKFNELLLEISYRRLYGKSSTEEHPLPESAYTLNEWALEVPVEYPVDQSAFRKLHLKTPLETSLLVDVPSSVFIFQLVDVLNPYYQNLPIYFAEHDKIRTAFITVPESEDLNQVSDFLNSQKIKLEDIVLVFRPYSEMGKTDNHLPDLLPEDLDVRLRLDLQLLYLRKIHSYCYYGKYKTNNYVDLWDSSGPGYVRVDLTNDLYDKEEGVFGQTPRIRFATFETSKDQLKEFNETFDWEQELKDSCTVSEQQLLWIKDVESFAKKILETDLAPPKFELSESVEEKWKQFCNLNTLIDAPDKFRCKLCSKLFNDAKFVWKHLKKVHGESYNQVVVECGVPKMRELFFDAHRDTRSNPFENLVTLPIIQKPKSNFDNATKEFFKKVEIPPPDRKKRPRDYYDFDEPKLKKEFVTFAPDEYSRPSVKYDDL
uniref:C2H2-type domain-containing protein n=1 Tax=Theileria parva TaxID=5875 RepID=Q4N872_THEPA|eukprot:XP_766119.1 hypothetical protein [Theileria parva strain Muguga]